MQGLLADYLPDWLPDDPNKHEAMRNGLLNFGAALMGGRGNLGQILGSGLMAGSKGYAGSLAAQQASALQQAQFDQTKLENQKLQAQIDEPLQLAKIFQGAGPIAGPSTASAGGVKPVSALPQRGATSLDGALPGYQPRFSRTEAQGAIDSAGAQGLGNEPTTLNSLMSGARESSPAAAPAAQTDLFQRYVSYGDMLTQAGKPAAAKQYYEMAQKMKPEVQEVKTAMDAQGNPVQVITFKDGTQKTSSYGALPENQVVDVGGRQILVDKHTGKQGASFDKTQSPDNIASNATTRRGQDMTHADANVDVPITSDAITNAAARYNVDGTLPPMGMGKAAAAGRSAILNKAAELKMGVDPEQQRRDQIGNKNDLASQGAALRAFTSGKQGNSVRSFNVLQSHLDTFGTMADAMNNGDVQLLNRVANAYAAKTGQAAPTNFEAIKHIVGDEIVKAVTGSAGALGDREAAAKTIASINSPAQLKGVIESYKELANGQLKGLRQQYETSTGRTDFDKYLSQQAQQTRAPKEVKDLPQKAPATALAFDDAAKERRYQEWKRSQAK